MTIQQLTDIDIANKIGQFLTGSDAFDQTWAPKEKALALQAPIDSLSNELHQYWYVESDAGGIIAALGIRENKYGSGGYEMDSDYVAVHRNYRKQGIASKLLVEAENFVVEHRGRFIHILTCDIPSYAAARAFYEKHNYRKVAEMPNYYVPGEGRIDYFKELQ